MARLQSQKNLLLFLFLIGLVGSVFVFIALMVVFIIGPSMNHLDGRREVGQKVVAHYDDGKKISRKDLVWAQQQLEILKMLNADVILRPMDPRLSSTQDLRTVLLGELLFAERYNAAKTIGYIRQIVKRGGYGISDKQINCIYTKNYPSSVYWLLLTKEARQAGFITPPEKAKMQLEALMPRLYRGASYSQVLSAIAEKQGFSEQQVLETFADMTSVIEYAKIMCSKQNHTDRQVLHEPGQSSETMDVEYVLFDADEFIEQAGQPGEDEIGEQFEKYKVLLAGDVNEDNLYGFGYKLPDRVQLEYIAVRMDDVASTIPQPTRQEMEEFYQQNISRFTERVPLDPNDPNSQLTTRTRSYAEVASQISRSLYQQRVDSKAEQILNEARAITEADLPGFEDTQAKISDEQIREKAGSYEKTAAELAEKYKLKVYAGKTGLLSAADMQSDKILGMLYIEGVGFPNMGLLRIVFAVESLKASELGPVDIRPPRLYENIGPLKDVLETTRGYAGKSMLLGRVIQAEKAAVPENIDQKIDRRTVRFDNEDDGDVITVRKLVIEDLKRLAARDIANARASEFVRLADKDGWEAAIEKFNELYHKGVKGAEGDANTISHFALQKRTGIRRISERYIAAIEIRYEGDPMARELLFRDNVERLLIDELYSLVPPDANTLPKPGVVVDFKPTLSYYCIKSITIHRLNKDQSDKILEEFQDAQVLAAVHYNPENIVKRMNFSIIKEQKGSDKPESSP